MFQPKQVGFWKHLLLARNEKQISNFKAQSHASAFPHLSLDAAADDLFIVMQQAYTEDASKKFVQWMQHLSPL